MAIRITYEAAEQTEIDFPLKGKLVDGGEDGVGLSA
jgi:hypothetical protein